MHRNEKRKQSNGLYRMDLSWSISLFSKIQSISARNIVTRKWVYGPSDKTAFAFSFCFFRTNDMRVKIGGRIGHEFHSYPYFRRRCAVPQGFRVENSNGNRLRLLNLWTADQIFANITRESELARSKITRADWCSRNMMKFANNLKFIGLYLNLHSPLF